MYKPGFHAVTAEGCAWRAFYTYYTEKGGFSHQLLSIGIDPNNGVKPRCFGWLFNWSWSFTLPWVRFKYPCNRVHTLLYQFSQWFWFNMDGRWGWGTKRT